MTIPMRDNPDSEDHRRLDVFHSFLEAIRGQERL